MSVNARDMLDFIAERCTPEKEAEIRSQFDVQDSFANRFLAAWDQKAETAFDIDFAFLLPGNKPEKTSAGIWADEVATPVLASEPASQTVLQAAPDAFPRWIFFLTPSRPHRAQRHRGSIPNSAVSVDVWDFRDAQHDLNVLLPLAVWTSAPADGTVTVRLRLHRNRVPSSDGVERIRLEVLPGPPCPLIVTIAPSNGVRYTFTIPACRRPGQSSISPAIEIPEGVVEVPDGIAVEIYSAESP